MELSNFQRWILGISLAAVTSITSVLDGVVLFYYYQNHNVTPESLSLSNFIVGLFGCCFAILIGNLHYQMKESKKFYFLLFAVLYSLALCLRYGVYLSSSSSGSSIAIYYVTSYSIEIIGRTGLVILQETWIIEYFDDNERRKLYPILTAAGICGIILGLAIASFPLRYIGIFISLLIIFSNLYIMTYFTTSSSSSSSTSLEKQLPSVTSMASVFENQQYLIVLISMIGFWFYKSLPSLFMFFLADVMKLNQNALSFVYVMCVLAYIVGGIIAYPLTTYFTKHISFTIDYKHSLAQIALFGSTVGYILLFFVSYTHWSFVVIVLVLIGTANSCGSTIYKIFCADCVDYDQLLSCIKRPEVYVSVTSPLNILFSIASVSIPLAIMALCGFEPVQDDQDDKSHDNDTAASTLALRLWCSFVLASLCIVAYLILNAYYKVSQSVDPH